MTTIHQHERRGKPAPGGRRMRKIRPTVSYGPWRDGATARCDRRRWPCGHGNRDDACARAWRVDRCVSRSISTLQSGPRRAERPVKHLIFNDVSVLLRFPAATSRRLSLRKRADVWWHSWLPYRGRRVFRQREACRQIASAGSFVMGGGTGGRRKRHPSAVCNIWWRDVVEF